MQSEPMPTGTTTRRRAALLAIASTCLGVGVLAGTASAHTAPITADCDGVRVVLTDYNPDGVNSVTVYIDGALRSTTTFGDGTSAVHPFTDPTVAHTWRVVVSAWDDPTGSNGWSRDSGTHTVPVCASPTSAPATTAPASTAPPTTSTATTAPASTVAVGTVPGPVTPTTNATVASVVVTAPPSAGTATTAVVAQAAPTTASPVVPASSPATTAPAPAAAGGTLPVTGSDAQMRLLGAGLMAFGFGVLVVVATRRPQRS